MLDVKDTFALAEEWVTKLEAFVIEWERRITAKPKAKRKRMK